MVVAGAAYIRVQGQFPLLGLFLGQGLAIELMKEFVTNLRKAGVERIYTLVNWNDWDLLRFFEKSGFVPAKMLNLELQIT